MYINFVKDFHNKPQINTTKKYKNIYEENEKKKQQAVAGP